MLTKRDLIEACGSLIANMFPEKVALSFGFSENPSERFWCAAQNQSVRDAVKTILFFSIKNSAWKSPRAAISKFKSNGTEFVEELRQVTLTIDVYSKIMPPGTAQDVVRYIGAKIQSSFFDEWRELFPEIGFAFEGMDSIDLSPLLQTQTWSERCQCTIRLNYKDTITLTQVAMTRVPTSIGDVRNSVDYVVENKK